MASEVNPIDQTKPVRSRRGSCAPTDRPKDMPKSAKTGRRTEVATSNRPVGAEQQLQERKRTEPRRERGRHQTGNAVRRVKVIVLHEVSPSRGGVPDRTVSRRVLMIMLRSAVSAYRGSASRVQKEVTIPLQRARPGRASRLPRTRNRCNQQVAQKPMKHRYKNRSDVWGV